MSGKPFAPPTRPNDRDNRHKEDKPAGAGIPQPFGEWPAATMGCGWRPAGNCRPNPAPGWSRGVSRAGRRAAGRRRPQPAGASRRTPPPHPAGALRNRQNRADSLPIPPPCNLPKWHNRRRRWSKTLVKPLIYRSYADRDETCQNFVACFLKKMLARIGSRAFMPVTGQMWHSLRRRSFPVRDYSTRLPRRAKAQPSGFDHRANQD